MFRQTRLELLNSMHIKFNYWELGNGLSSDAFFVMSRMGQCTTGLQLYIELQKESDHLAVFDTPGLEHCFEAAGKIRSIMQRLPEILNELDRRGDISISYENSEPEYSYRP